jgi:hypothetical protein
VHFEATQINKMRMHIRMNRNADAYPDEQKCGCISGLTLMSPHINKISIQLTIKINIQRIRNPRRARISTSLSRQEMDSETIHSAYLARRPVTGLLK